jgi:peptidoglycan hydrolase CwlO-like protein
MNKQFKYKINGFETRPKFNEGTFCCVHSNAGPVVLESCSHKELVQKNTQGQVQIAKDDTIGFSCVCDSYEYGNRLIHRQDQIINELTKQISNGEKELLKKEKQIVQLESDIEEICKKLFSEVDLRC